jgi:hypothetical protein
MFVETLWKKRRDRKDTENAENSEGKQALNFSASLRLRVLRVDFRAQELPAGILR